MAVAQYNVWVKAGRPLTPAKPIAEIVARLKVAFPHGGPFSWFANESHYTAVPPGDHTPYSADGWKLKPSPYPIVFATDVMHQPTMGVDCFKLFDYWLAEAKAGRMPWLKYLIWQGHIYDARYNWAQQVSDDHFDHIHISTRTDYQNATLGEWSLVPGGAMADNVDYDQYDRDRVTATWGAIQAMQKQIADLITAVAKLTIPQPLPVDLEAVRTIVRDELDKTHLSD